MLQIGLSLIIVQAITLGSAPLITRLFDAEMFGNYGVFTSIQALLMAMISAKYDSAIIAAKKNIEVTNLASLSLLLAGVSVILLMFIFIGFKITGLNYMITGFEKPMAMAPVGAFLNVTYSIVTETFLRIGDAKSVLIIRFTNAIGIAIATIVFGRWSVKSGLIYGQCIGMVIAVLFGLTILVNRKIFKTSDISRKRICVMAIRYKRFPRYTLPAQIINNFAAALPLISISHQFGAREAGIFALVERVLFGPISLFGTSVRDVLKREGRICYQETGNCLSLFKNTTIALTVFSIALFSMIFLVVGDAFAVLFGHNWIDGGKYARILLFSYAVMLIAMPTGCFIALSGRQHLEMNWQIIFLFLNVLPLFFSYLCNNVIIFISTLSFVRTLAFALLLLINYRSAFRCLEPKLE